MRHWQIAGRARPSASRSPDYTTSRRSAFTTTGPYDHGPLREVFLNGRKIGTHEDTAARGSAVAASIAIQCGVDVDVIRHALCRDVRGEAMGPLGRCSIRFWRNDHERCRCSRRTSVIRGGG